MMEINTQNQLALCHYPIDILLHLYSTMLKIRYFEESLVEPILHGVVRCPVHLYTGQEAVATGACAALTRSDYVFSTHRSHGHYIAKGGDLKALASEVFCKDTGCSKGRGGSMHLIDPGNGFLGSAPIVGGTISLALGAALACQIRSKNVSVSFFGDGATGEGVLYESMNFAALKRLPLIFICENNLYSTHLPINRCRPNNDIFRIGEPFDISSFVVDGNNVLDVYEVSRRSVDLCRHGDGPVLIECKTYRIRGHVGPDDNIQGTHTDIRPKDEIELWTQKDPVKRFEGELLESGIITAEIIEIMKVDNRKEVDEAILYAENSPYPQQNELTAYVFKQ